MNRKMKIENVLEDFWVGISPDLDLNIWIDENGVISCDIYLVKDGTIGNYTIASAITKLEYTSGEKE